VAPGRPIGHRIVTGRRGRGGVFSIDGRAASSYDRPVPIEEEPVPLFMDVHNIEGGVSASDVADAHMKDLETQAPYDVNYKQYWVDEKNGKIFCLVEAPDAETAHTVHREAHGLVADEIYEVREGS
jgi:hypothetical protein